MRRALTFAALVLASTGCRHWHVEHNAPGIVDVRTPPVDIRKEQLEPPRDPGERMLSINPGVSFGSGARSRDGGAGIADFGAEVSFLRGESDRSHNDEEERLFLPPGFQLPERGWGVTLGWDAIRFEQVEDDDPATEELETRETLVRGPVHARGYVFRSWFGGGLGWTWDLDSGDHGPELVGYAGVVTLRTRWTLEKNFELVLGYQLKFPLTRVESR